jgi:hypothetical protein
MFYVVQTLHGVVRDSRTVIVSIHQPSSKVFELFDQSWCSLRVETMYFGQTREAYEVVHLSLRFFVYMCSCNANGVSKSCPVMCISQFFPKLPSHVHCSMDSAMCNTQSCCARWRSICRSRNSCWWWSPDPCLPRRLSWHDSAQNGLAFSSAYLT